MVIFGQISDFSECVIKCIVNLYLCLFVVISLPKSEAALIKLALSAFTFDIEKSSLYIRIKLLYLARPLNLTSVADPWYCGICPPISIEKIFDIYNVLEGAETNF